MSKLTDALRDVRVFNPHAFHAPNEGSVWIQYTPTDTGRGGRGAHWTVYGNGFQTDPDGHWRDYGQKTFLVYGRGTHAEAKAEALEEAKAFAAKYGVTEWARCPYGCWADATFVKGRTKALKAEIKKATEDS